MLVYRVCLETYVHIYTQYVDLILASSQYAYTCTQIVRTGCLLSRYVCMCVHTLRGMLLIGQKAVLGSELVSCCV